MHKKTVLGIRLDRFIFVLASAPVLIACGILTGQPWYETALAVYSVLALMVLAEGRRGGPAFGIAFCLAYGALFFSKQTYGLAFFNTFFGASVYVFSLISWGKHKSGGAIEVKRLPPKGWAIALAGTFGYVLNGWETPGLPQYSLGYVSLPATLGVAATSVFIAPLGARFSHALPLNVLRKIFAAFLVLMAVRMVWEVLA